MARPVAERSMSVLVVDDNEELCDNVKEILESHGYLSTCVLDGFKAIDRVKRDPPDVIIMDVKLPGMNGLAALRKIKEIAPKVRVIMITGYAVDDILDEAKKAGAVASLRKPLDFPKLLALLEART